MIRLFMILTSLTFSAASFAQHDFLKRIDPDIRKSAIIEGPTHCQDANTTLTKPRSDTTPSERYAAAVIIRQCLEQDRSRRMGTAKGNTPLTYQIFESYIEQANARIKIEDAGQDFMGISFGVGVGVSFSDDDIISAAELDANNIIRATEDESTLPRVILESHYYGFCKTARCNEGRFGVGPYFGIVARDDKLISAFSTGVMFGWRDENKPSSAAFSVGIGAILDSDVKSLADGFEDGQPLPDGETDIRFKTESRWGAILFFTRTF